MVSPFTSFKEGQEGNPNGAESASPTAAKSLWFLRTVQDCTGCVTATPKTNPPPGIDPHATIVTVKSVGYVYEQNKNEFSAKQKFHEIYT